MMKVRIYNDKLEMLEVTFNSVAEAEPLGHYLDFLGAKYEEEITEQEEENPFSVKSEVLLYGIKRTAT